MQRDRERIAEPERAREQQRRMAAEEEDRDVGAARRVQHQDGEEASSAANHTAEPHAPGEIHTWPGV